MIKSTFGTLQKIGKALMLPVAVLPVAGILLGVGSAGFSFIPDLISSIMAHAGGAVFSNLPLIFAIGTAIGLAGNDGVSSVAAVVGFVIMLGTMGIMANQLGFEPSSVMGISTIDTGVFGGIIVGILASVMFNRYYKIQLPEYLGFFAGKRFVPIATGIGAIFLGILLSFIWPPVQSVINNFSHWSVNENPEAAGFVYGFVERLLIPFGLHHIWNVPFHMEMGEFIDESGTVFNGDIARFFAGDPTAGFLAGGYLFKMFGLPAAAIAMWHCAKPENRAKAGGIMISAALTSLLTGITEPIEFSFLFVAPLLYGMHALLAGMAYTITNYLNIKMAMSFSNGLIDYVLYFGIATKPVWIIILGALYAVLYYVIFRVLILALNLKTPGREDESDSEVNVGPSSELAVNLINAFGGQGNIKHLDACITRLRVTVNNTENADIDRIKQLGATAVVVVGHNMQAIFGPKSCNIRTEMQEAMKTM
ncbi:MULTISPECIES: PTS glucose transporter subunit IIBC [unclassified Endozoicomonas]|uniref:PTS glucose transporter subunit IIBC n=1 Tax=unclassified Endozoicomonas TaxID=2644528 RepID=UPI003BB53C49